MRNSANYGLTAAVRDHLATGKPITRLEALILYGVSDLTKEISGMRKAGWTIESRRVPYARAVQRVNEHARLEMPSNLPIREILLTEYWMNR